MMYIQIDDEIYECKTVVRVGVNDNWITISIQVCRPCSLDVMVMAHTYLEALAFAWALMKRVWKKMSTNTKVIAVRRRR